MMIGQQPSAGHVWLIAVKVYTPISLNKTTFPVAIGAVLPSLYHFTSVYLAGMLASIFSVGQRLNGTVKHTQSISSSPSV